MIPGVNIDTLTLGPDGQIAGSGNVGRILMANNFNVNALRTNDVLRKDEWKAMDDVLIEVARNRLVVVDELLSRGLTYTIGNGLGTTQLEWEQVNDMEPAQESMAGITEGERDTLEFTLQSMPLPIIHKDFNINIRKLEASRTTGQPLDLAQAEMASRLVVEKVESMAILGSATRVGTARIYGLTTEPNRNTGSNGGNWELSATTGQDKLDDVIAMMDDAANDNMYGPFGLYITQTAMTNLSNDYKANSDKSQLQRLMEVPNLAFIKPSKDIVTGTLVLVQLTRDVMDEVIGLQPTVVQWESNGGMTQNFKVMAIMVPRVRSTVTGQSGIVHYT